MTPSSEVAALLAARSGDRHPMLLAGDGAETGSGIANVSAVDGRSLGRVAVAGAKDVALALDAAARVRKDWAAVTTGQRVAVLESVAAAIQHHRAALARLITLEVAKPIALAVL